MMPNIAKKKRNQLIEDGYCVIDNILNEEVQEYNQLYKQEGLPAVIIPEK